MEHVEFNWDEAQGRRMHEIEWRTCRDMNIDMNIHRSIDAWTHNNVTNDGLTFLQVYTPTTDYDDEKLKANAAEGFRKTCSIDLSCDKLVWSGAKIGGKTIFIQDNSFNFRMTMWSAISSTMANVIIEELENQFLVSWMPSTSKFFLRRHMVLFKQNGS